MSPRRPPAAPRAPGALAGEAAWRRLAEHGVRRTAQRDAIVATLVASAGALPVPVIHARARRQVPGLGLRTVERTIALLARSGGADAIARPSGEVAYRLCGAHHHHHLVCSACGAVAELAPCDLGAWVDARARDHGFAVGRHELTVHGLCPACAPVLPR